MTPNSLRGPAAALVVVSTMLATSLAGAPVAAGSGSLDAVLVEVHIEDSHGLDCALPVAGFCLFDVTGLEEGVGNSTIDANQRVYYVGIATNFRFATETSGELSLLPDDSVTIRGTDYYIEHPVFRASVDTWQILTGNASPSESHPLEMTEDGAHATYPSLAEAGGDQRWSPGPWSRNCVTYERVGPCHVWRSGSTDDRVEHNAQGPCPWTWLVPSACDQVIDGAVRAWKQHTPNVIVGIEYQEAQVATAPTLLAPPLPPPSSGDPIDSAFWEAPSTWDGREAPPPQPRSPAQQLTPAPLEPPWTGTRTATPAVAIFRVSSPVDFAGSAPIVVLVVAGSTVCLLLLLGALLYSRFTTKACLLASPTRRAVIEAVERQPGIHLRELASRLSLAHTTAAYHVRILQRACLLSTVKTNWRLHLYLAGQELQHGQPPAALHACGEVTRRVVRALEETPDGLARADLHRLLEDVPKRTRNKAFKRLLDRGILHEVHDEAKAPWLRLCDA